MKLLGRLGLLVVLLLPLYALYQVFMVVPDERTMGVIQRIFYFHVGSAATAFIAFFVVMIAGIGYLATGRAIWDQLGYALSEVGMCFLTIVLVTGPLWGRPVWGHYWSWQDARLVTTFVLWIFFAVVLLLRRGWENDPQGQRFAAVLGIVGFVDVPIIYFSVKWWNFVHPSHVVGPAGGGLDPAMGRALGISTMALMVLATGLVMLRVRLSRTQEQLTVLSRRLAREGA